MTPDQIAEAARAAGIPFDAKPQPQAGIINSGPTTTVTMGDPLTSVTFPSRLVGMTDRRVQKWIAKRLYAADASKPTDIPVDAAAFIAGFSKWPGPLQATVLQYLESSGWLQSAVTRRPVDRRGNPIPWYTYAATRFLEGRIVPDLQVFEFGSGNSTRWWSRRAVSVTSVEHDPRFVTENNNAGANVTVFHVPEDEDGAYCRAAENTGKRFDVVVIDGRDRANCARHTPGVLTERGVIIWDNSQRSHYAEAQAWLLSTGFRRVEFMGATPIINTARSETTIFYRGDNWLGL